jgi:hypothetical protein
MDNRIRNRFGTIAVEKGFITKDQLVEALSVQARENVENGSHRLIGQILLDCGLMTQAQIDEVLEMLNNTMILTLAAGR